MLGLRASFEGESEDPKGYCFGLGFRLSGLGLFV